jgi:hypothetical protein
MIPRLALVAACAVGLGGFVAAPAQAAAAVTISAPTKITLDSATLHGTINTGGLALQYTFGWGTSTAYDNFTPTVYVPKGSGTINVSELIDGELTPNTKYHVKLFVTVPNFQAYYVPPSVTSSDLVFKTASYGTDALTSKKIKVTHGKAPVGLKCNSKVAPCKGKLGLTMHDNKGKLLDCGSAKYALKAGKKGTTKVKLSKGCLALLAASKKLQHSATLGTRSTTGQPRLSKKVLLYL